MQPFTLGQRQKRTLFRFNPDTKYSVIITR